MSDPTPSHRDPHASGSHYQPSLGVVFIIVILFIGATFLMVGTITSSKAVPTTTAPSTTTTKPSSVTRVIKSRVRVQVANGTTVPQLAATYTQKLMTQDWDTLPPVNGPSEKKTVIYYNASYLDAAREVASAIKVSESAVRPLGALKPVPDASGDDVIVIIGHDQTA
ncbi:MAG: LytR C-terminal domain-containing protein [Acidimicrobiales bacterium]